MKDQLKSKLLHELKEYWHNFIFLAVFFSIFAIYRRLLLAHYGVYLEDYGISIIKALILAKVIMIGDILHIGRRLSGKPLIYFVLIKSLAFTIWVALFDVVELLIRGYIETHTINGAFHDFLSHINGVLIGGLLVVYCAFVPFFALKELSRKVGQEKFHELFFKKDESL